MELPSKILEQIAFNTRPKIEEHMLFVMEKSAHEEYLSHPLPTNNKQYKVDVTFLNGCDGIFNVTNETKKFTFISNFEGAENNMLQVPLRAYEPESFNAEVKRNFIEEGYITEEAYPFGMKPNFSTLGSFIQLEPVSGWQISFLQVNTLRGRLGFKARVIYDEHNLSDYPVHFLSFDNIFHECDTDQGKIFESN